MLWVVWLGYGFTVAIAVWVILLGRFNLFFSSSNGRPAPYWRLYILYIPAIAIVAFSWYVEYVPDSRFCGKEFYPYRCFNGNLPKYLRHVTNCVIITTHCKFIMSLITVLISWISFLASGMKAANLHGLIISVAGGIFRLVDLIYVLKCHAQINPSIMAINSPISICGTWIILFSDIHSSYTTIFEREIHKKELEDYKGLIEKANTESSHLKIKVANLNDNKNSLQKSYDETKVSFNRALTWLIEQTFTLGQQKFTIEKLNDSSNALSMVRKTMLSLYKDKQVRRIRFLLNKANAFNMELSRARTIISEQVDLIQTLRGLLALPKLEEVCALPAQEVEVSCVCGSCSYEEVNVIETDAHWRKALFNYEESIRTRSPPEKVFEHFSSVRHGDGEIFMTLEDLMRSVIPLFPPSGSNRPRVGCLGKERSRDYLRCALSDFLKLFDPDNNGLISVKEYIFFVTLLSIPESSFSVAFKMFDLDSKGEIHRDEFKTVMMRAQNRQGALHSDGLRAGLRVGGSVENGGILKHFFGKDGEKCLHHDTFVQFLRDLHDEMLDLEFFHYDNKSVGTISAEDFALSMVASADLKELNRLLNRVDILNHKQHLKNICVTFEEFKDFAKLRKMLQPFSLAFSFSKVNGLLTRNDFKQAASQLCGISLSYNVIELIFHVFDANGDGNLSYNEFVRVLKQRERDIAHPIEAAGI